MQGLQARLVVALERLELGVGGEFLVHYCVNVTCKACMVVIVVHTAHAGAWVVDNGQTPGVDRVVFLKKYTRDSLPIIAPIV